MKQKSQIANPRLLILITELFERLKTMIVNLRCGITFILICNFQFAIGNYVYAQKEAKTSIETKIALETNLENRLKRILTEITGSEKIVIIVNVQLESEKKEKKQEQKKDEMILPGVPIKETLTEKKVESVMLSALGDDTRTLIKKLSVTIILDKSIPPSVVEIVKKVASGLLGIEPERGDELSVQQMNFQKNPFKWSSLILPPNLYWLLAAIAGIGLTLTLSLFLFGPFQKFAKDIVAAAVSSAASIKEKSSEQAAGVMPIGAIQETEREQEQKLAVSSDGKEPLFSFVNENSIEKIIHILGNEPEKNIAVIVNYLPSDTAALILNRLPDDKRKNAIALLSKTETLNPEEVKRIETDLKKRVEYFFGGAEILTRITDSSTETVQQAIISDIKDINPELAEKINSYIIRIDMLATLDTSGIQLVIKQIGTYVFGQILKTLPSETQEKVFSVLPAGAAARVKQEMELGKPLPANRIEREKRRILNIMRRLKEAGMI